MWKTLAVKQRVVWFIMSTRININLPVSASQGSKQRERGGWFDGGGAGSVSIMIVYIQMQSAVFHI